MPYLIIFLMIAAALSLLDIRAMKNNPREIVPYLALIAVAIALGAIYFSRPDQVSFLSRINRIISR